MSARAQRAACAPALPGRHGIDRLAALAILALLPAAPVAAMAPEAEYPAAQCAAFFYGRDDYARRSTYLTRTPGDLDLALGFRDVAVRLNGGAAGEVDTFIAQERKTMAFLFEAFIFGGDEQSRDIHDRLIETCVDYAAQTPETKAAE